MLVVLAGYGRRGAFWTGVLARTGEHRIAAILEPDAVRGRLAQQAFPNTLVCVPDDLPHCTADLAIVSSPAGTHAAVAAGLAERVEGVSLLVEKPVGDARESLESVLSLPVPKWSGYLERLNDRFLDCLAVARAVLHTGDLVELEIERVRPSPNGKLDALVDLMPHDFHALATARLVDRSSAGLHLVRRTARECLLECHTDNLRITLRAAYGIARTRVRASVGGVAVAELTQEVHEFAAIRHRSALALVDEIRAGSRQSEMAAEARSLTFVHECISAAAQSSVVPNLA